MTVSMPSSRDESGAPRSHFTLGRRWSDPRGPGVRSIVTVLVVALVSVGLSATLSQSAAHAEDPPADAAAAPEPASSPDSEVSPPQPADVKPLDAQATPSQTEASAFFVGRHGE